MHSHFLDTYNHLNSPIHRLPPTLKMVLALGLVVALVSVPPSPRWYLASAIALVCVAAASRVPALFLTKRLIFLEPFVIMAAFLALFQPHGGVHFLIVAARSSLCLFTLILLSNTTPFSELLDVLRRLQMPPIMMTTLALMYRYLYVLRDESARMRTARASRTFTRDKWLAWRNLAAVAAQLFIRTGVRAERVYWAMCSRGWK